MAFRTSVRYSAIQPAPVKDHFVGQIRVEDGVIDLADDRRDFRGSHRDGQFMIQTTRDFDLEPAFRAFHDFQRVPFRGAGFVDLELLFGKGRKVSTFGEAACKS